MRFKTKLQSNTSLIDLTPLVDVIFLLLIFFIVTSDILPLKSLNIENPTLEKNSPALTTQVPVIMDKQNVIYVGSKKAIVDLASLQEAIFGEIEKIRQQYSNSSPTVIISVDKNVAYEDFLKLFSIVQNCTPKIRLAYKYNEQNER